MISHGYGLNIFHEVYETKKIENEMDFKSLILKVYESKNRGLKHLFPDSDAEMTIDEKIMKTRSIIKSVKCLERETIPLPSVLRYQFARAEYLFHMMTDDTFFLNPSEHGWALLNSEYQIILQDEEDVFFNLPKKLMTSCACRHACKSCKCIKTMEIGNKCSRMLCKVC